jgi:hypothetical protein
VARRSPRVRDGELVEVMDVGQAKYDGRTEDYGGT